MLAVRRLLAIVKTSVRRLFESWTDFFEYLVFMGVCVAGIVHASWLWIAIGAMALFLLGWPRWGELVAKAEAWMRSIASSVSWRGDIGTLSTWCACSEKRITSR